MLAELTQTVSRVEQNQLEVGQGFRSLAEGIRVLSAQQARLIELLVEMIVRLDQQNYLLKDVSDTVSRAVTALPWSVVRAIADAFPPADEPAGATRRNGHEGGTA